MWLSAGTRTSDRNAKSAFDPALSNEEWADAQYRKVTAKAGCVADYKLQEDGSESDKPDVPISIDGDTATLLVYGPLDPWYGWDTSEVVKALMEAKPATLEMLISSPGGYADEGLLLASAIRRMSMPENASGTSWGMAVNAAIDNYIASAATLPYVIADERRIASTDVAMIHKPWGGTFLFGDASDWEKQYKSDRASLLTIENQAMRYYELNMSISKDEIMEKIDGQDFWLDADEAMDTNFSNVLIDKKEEDESEMKKQPSEPTKATEESKTRVLQMRDAFNNRSR